MSTATKDLVKVVMGGTIAGNDSWSTSTSLIVTGGTPSAADMNGIANGAATLFATSFWDVASSGWKSAVAASTIWSTCKTYYYPAGSDTATVSGSKALTPDPGTNVTGIPPQCSLVISLLTGFPGRQMRGRNYLPAACNITATGRQTSTWVTNASQHWAAYLDGLNSMTVGSLSFNACIGTHNCPVITQVRVDDIIDTQRRRRDKQVATSIVTTSL